jgi:hypothetical protein
LVICLGASQRLDDRLVNLTGIVNELETTANEPLELAAIVGVVLRPDMQGKHLDLMAWKLGRNGEPQKLDGYVGTPLILPKGLGPIVLPYSVRVPICEDGVYGFYLYDREGAFGSPEELLATYMYSVTVD